MRRGKLAFYAAAIRNLLGEYSATAKWRAAFLIAIADARADHTSRVPVIVWPPWTLLAAAQRCSNIVFDAAERPARFDGIKIKLELVIRNAASA